MAENNSRIQELVPNVKKDRSSHRRSIVEPWRRTEISKRVRNLQELVPNMEKQTNTSDMLDLAVDYIKELQMQIKVMKEEEAICTCLPSKQNHSPVDEAQQPAQSKPTLDEASAVPCTPS
uniref:BHLH domain-containing protein n=1 Tax=Hordeum vulgare subsp. vulgare TaxID=112509 RepID=A0A8I7B336_HORVV